MSSWKGTVMSEQGLDKLAKANPLLDFSFEDDYREEVRLMREAQAKIAWDKAIREVVEWIPQLIQSIKDAMWKDDWGVKGVIYEDMLDSLVKKLVKAKLKDWGISEAEETNSQNVR